MAKSKRQLALEALLQKHNDVQLKSTLLFSLLYGAVFFLASQVGSQLISRFLLGLALDSPWIMGGVGLIIVLAYLVLATVVTIFVFHGIYHRDFSITEYYQTRNNSFYVIAVYKIGLFAWNSSKEHAFAVHDPLMVGFAIGILIISLCIIKYFLDLIFDMLMLRLTIS